MCVRERLQVQIDTFVFRKIRFRGVVISNSYIYIYIYIVCIFTHVYIYVSP